MNEKVLIQTLALIERNTLELATAAKQIAVTMELEAQEAARNRTEDRHELGLPAGLLQEEHRRRQRERDRLWVELFGEDPS